MYPDINCKHFEYKWHCILGWWFYFFCVFDILPGEEVIDFLKSERRAKATSTKRQWRYRLRGSLVMRLDIRSNGIWQPWRIILPNTPFSDYDSDAIHWLYGNLTSSMLANDTDTVFVCVVFGIGFSWIFFVVSGAGSEESLGSLCGIRWGGE